VRALRALERIGADATLADRVVLTPACGLAAWTPAQASQAFAVLKSAAEQVDNELAGG